MTAARTRLGGLAGRGLAGLAGAGVSAAAQFAVVVLVTRGAGQEAAGSFFAATALCLMAAGVLRLDTGNGLVHVIARDRLSGRPEGSGPARRDPSGPPRSPGPSGHVRAALIPVLTLSAAVAAAALVWAEEIAGVAGTPGAVRVLALALPVVVCADVLVAATRGFGEMRPTVVLDGILRPAGQLLLVGLVVAAAAVPPDAPAPGAPAPAPGGTGSGRDVPWPGPADLPWLLVAAWALPYLPVLLLAAARLRRLLPREPYPPGTAHGLWRHLWPRSAAAAVQAVFQRLDVVIVAVLAGPVEAAVYTAATRFKIVGQLAGQGLAQAAQPRLVRALAGGDLPHARELYQSTTAWLVLLTWPVWLGYAALAPWLLGLFGGGSGDGGYASGVPVALVLSATMALATACGMADVILTAAGHTRLSLANLLAAVAVTVALDVALIPAHGALGAALGWSGGVLVKNLLPLWQIHRRYGLRPFGAHTAAACVPRLRPPTPGTPSSPDIPDIPGGSAGHAPRRPR
ncbi:lipopolysaccharide biosynthesis protein [Planomonospora venezuelensis]|uniref:O-antigen/teichoic acid export membrane protein n=1 Tax=Planomonospora venezuelensis TaxID=1999 RepID=A0A841D2I6_PLAVE|nr:O-antigen/teichoic acid export membrane protein [Planomonospora venezuelensis]